MISLYSAHNLTICSLLHFPPKNLRFVQLQPDAGYGEASMTLNMLHKLELDDPFTDESTPYSDFLDNLMDRWMWTWVSTGTL